MPLFNHFDFLAPIYDRVISPSDPALLEELLNLPIQGALLDAGGGTGRGSQAFFSMATQIIIADSSFPMLIKAKSKVGLGPVCVDTKSMPFLANSIERIMVVDAYHHLAEQLTSLTELWRILSNNGRLVIEEPDIRALGVKLVALAEKLALMQSQFVHAEALEEHLIKLGATTSVVRDGYTYWVIADKKPSKATGEI